MRTVQEIIDDVVTNYQDINGLMQAQFELAQISYSLAEQYAQLRKRAKLKEKEIEEQRNNDFLNYNSESGINTTTAKAMAKNATKAEAEKELIEFDCKYKGNDRCINQINRFLNAINQQIAFLRQELSQTKSLT